MLLPLSQGRLGFQGGLPLPPEGSSIFKRIQGSDLACFPAVVCVSLGRGGEDGGFCMSARRGGAELRMRLLLLMPSAWKVKPSEEFALPLVVFFFLFCKKEIKSYVFCVCICRICLVSFA